MLLLCRRICESRPVQRRGRALALSFAVGLLVAALGSAARAEETVEKRLAGERSALVGRLLSAAAWCTDNKVFAARDAIYWRILDLDPDHARARAALKFTRAGKGKPWVQGDYKPPKNWELGKVEEANRRLAEVSAGYVEKVQAVLDGAGEALPEARRVAVLEHLVDVAPEHAPLRKALGHVEHAGRWLLPESVAGLKRRAELMSLRLRAEKQAPWPQVDDAGRVLGWKGPRIAAGFRILTHDEGEGEAVARTMAIGDLFCRAALGPADAPETRFTLHFVADRDAAREWIDAQGPGYEEVRRELEQFGTLFLPTGALLSYVGDRDQRAATALRYVTGSWVSRIAAVERKRGWITEGLGQRLAWLACQTHGVNFGNVERTQAAQGGEAEEPEVDVPPRTEAWLPAAARVLSRDPVPRVTALLTRALNAMEPEDTLAAYALAAYLLEGRPEDLVGMVSASGSSDDAEQQVQTAFGVSVATLAWRLRRWTLETAALEHGAHPR